MTEFHLESRTFFRRISFSPWLRNAAFSPRICSLCVLLFLCGLSSPAFAVATLVQSATGTLQNTTSVSATFGTTPTAGNFLVAVCGDNSAETLAVSGWTSMINQSGTPSQGVFYKTAGTGESTTVTCTGATTSSMGIMIYEYSGLNSSPADQTASNTGSSASPSTGTTGTTSYADELLLGVITIVVSSTSPNFSSWTNSFTGRTDVCLGGGGPTSRICMGGADRSVTATGTYSTGATSAVSGSWRGQIVTFRVYVPAFRRTYYVDED